MTQPEIRERALLVAVTTGGEGGVAKSLEELARLVDTAGADTEAKIAAVREVLAEISADQVPELLVGQQDGHRSRPCP